MAKTATRSQRSEGDVQGDVQGDVHARFAAAHERYQHLQGEQAQLAPERLAAVRDVATCRARLARRRAIERDLAEARVALTAAHVATLDVQVAAAERGVPVAANALAAAEETLDRAQRAVEATAAALPEVRGAMNGAIMDPTRRGFEEAQRRLIAAERAHEEARAELAAAERAVAAAQGRVRQADGQVAGLRDARCDAALRLEFDRDALLRLPATLEMLESPATSTDVGGHSGTRFSRAHASACGAAHDMSQNVAKNVRKCPLKRCILLRIGPGRRKGASWAG